MTFCTEIFSNYVNVLFAQIKVMENDLEYNIKQKLLAFVNKSSGANKTKLRTLWNDPQNTEYAVANFDKNGIQYPCQLILDLTKLTKSVKNGRKPYLNIDYQSLTCL